MPRQPVGLSLKVTRLRRPAVLASGMCQH